MRAEQAAADGHRPSATAPAVWPMLVAGLSVVAAGVLAGVLASGPLLRQVLAGALVAALAVAAWLVPWWRMRREVLRLRHLDRAVAVFAATSGEAPVDTAVAAGVAELLDDAVLVGLHLGEPAADLQGLERVVVTDAVASGLPATVPDGTTGRETARLLALPVAAGGHRIGAVVVRTHEVSDRHVDLALQFLARVAPALAPTPPRPDPASAAPVASPESAATPRPSTPSTLAASGALPAPDARADADAALRELVARGAHDLRTPLNTLTGMVETLVRHGDRLPSEQRAQLHGALQRSTRRIAEWITTLLDAAVDEGFRPARAEPCWLQPLLEEATALTRAATAGLDVYVAPTDLHVVADPGEVVRVVANLLTNAGHHAHEGGTVEVEARPRDETVEVSVRDHGKGWDREVATSGNGRGSRQGHHAGHGLGLTSVRAQVEDWGGELELADTPGGGATVRFTLPRAVGDHPSPTVERHPGWTIAGRTSHVPGAQRPPTGGHGSQQAPSRRDRSGG